jgi:NADH-quinone oxidoreductase subunit E
MDSFELERIVDKYRYHESGLISILQDIQQRENYLPPDILRDLARRMGVPLAQVFGLATFYKTFSLKPRGRHIISVCMGTACHVKGGKSIVDKLKRDLDVGLGETTSDRRFTLETVRCVGCCGLAPVVKIDEDFHGKLTQSRIARALTGYE